MKFAPHLQNQFDLDRWRRAEKIASFGLLSLVVALVVGLFVAGFFV